MINIRTATITKNNEGPLGHLASFRPKIHDFGKDEDGDAVDVCLAEPVDGLPAPPALSWSPTEIVVTIPTPPSYPFTGPVTVTVNGQTGTGPPFSILAPV